jgi:2-methylisocitrate lyase-like PEP mutase family enzyme
MLLSSGKMVVAPGAIDCITGRLIDQAGFEAAYMTGAGTSATLGYPDYGLITMTEMVANASRIANSINIPLISDSDTGFGNELNMFRTVQEFERAGVAAIHVEDQVFPKKLRPPRRQGLVASREDYIAKIRARGRRAPHEGLRHHRPHRFARRARLRRGGRRVADCALANGADVVFLEAPQSLEEVASVPQRSSVAPAC